MDKETFIKRIREVEELNRTIIELKKAYLKSVYNMSDDEIEKFIDKWLRRETDY